MDEMLESSDDGERLARWVEVGAVMSAREPEMFASMLRAHEATTALLSTSPKRNIS